MAGPLLGVLGTVFGMLSAFSHLSGESVEPGALANDISLALYTTIAGMVVFLPGLACTIVATIKLGRIPRDFSGPG